MKIRSITIFTDITVPFDRAHIAMLSRFAQRAQLAYEDAGFEIQTLRLATNIFPALFESEWQKRPAAFVTTLETACNELGFSYIALGPAGLDMLPFMLDILSSTSSIFATTHILQPGTGTIDMRSIIAAARLIRGASAIENGFGNLRFSALANVAPGTPFFPGAYSEGKFPSYAIATESADLAVSACQQSRDAAEAYMVLKAMIEDNAKRIVKVAAQLASDDTPEFTGIDFSLAPYPDPAISIGGALEMLSGQPLGVAGSLSAAAILATAIQEANFPHTGFCGMMMPVLEDVILAQRAAEGRLRLGDLLQWSAVCGTGLDTVPLPGDVSEQALIHLLFDVAALSARLNKPLTARLMPLPGKSAGDPVHFDFPYFADGGVLAIDQGNPGRLDAVDQLHLPARNVKTEKR